MTTPLLWRSRCLQFHGYHYSLLSLSDPFPGVEETLFTETLCLLWMLGLKNNSPFPYPTDATQKFGKDLLSSSLGEDVKEWCTTDNARH